VHVQPGAGRRRHRDKATKSEGDATLDLLLKHPDATLVTYTLEKCI
jgi:hypothetical protein